MINCYQILGLNHNASEHEIKSSFKKLALKYHPDRNPEDHQSEERFKLINEAYQILSDPLKKALHDEYLLKDYSETTTHPSSGPETRHTRKYYQGFSRKVPPENRGKIHLAVALGFIAILFAMALFFNFMQKHTAKSLYRQATEIQKDNPYGAISLLSKAIERDDDFEKAHFLLGSIYVREKVRSAESISHLNRAITLSENPPKEYFWTLAIACYNAQRYQNSLEALEKSLLLSPDYLEAHLLKGDIFLYKELLFQEALSEYDKVLSIEKASDSLRREALIGFAVSQLQLNQPEKALPKLNDALLINPKNGIPYFYLGLYHLQVKDTLQACNLWSQAYQLGIHEGAVYRSKYCE
ncbi:DnaJ domain-containing protein [Rapidithrix thailandica]|uniref:DnaJ domain-containing protein n=1 Tax=Rapidithrix thailandica TaxID=413964 RepID=A0AAW9SA89_9BACT